MVTVAWAGTVWGRKGKPWPLTVGRRVRGSGWEPAVTIRDTFSTPGDLWQLLSPLLTCSLR